jgi:hypothetical protein
MQTGTIIDIIGIIVGLSGWAAFWLQIRTNRREVKQAQREVEQARLTEWATTLDSLHLLVGQWMDGITANTEFTDTFEETARRINIFIGLRGKFENETNLTLRRIPESRFDTVRERVGQFRTDALDTKTGLVRGLTNDNYRPTKDQWPAQREEALNDLREECDALLFLLEEESKRLRAVDSDQRQAPVRS